MPDDVAFDDKMREWLKIGDVAIRGGKSSRHADTVIYAGGSSLFQTERITHVSIL
jgi:hypothetical protein